MLVRVLLLTTSSDSTPPFILEVQMCNLLVFVFCDDLKNHRAALESAGVRQSLLACAVLLHCSEEISS